jgi:PhzF family phenazine biosynthesis protein
MRSFRQVDVFSAVPGLGNALAVVHDAEGLDDEAMQTFARWTNLSETTFLLPPTDPAADYRVRIFTTSTELPFAGHPTLGTAHAWLEAGGVPAREGVVVQECGVGLVEVRRGERLAFAAPPLVRSGDVDEETLARVIAASQVSRDDVVGAAWVDNGPGWVALELTSAEAVLAARVDQAHSTDLKWGLVGRWADPAAAGKDVEVRGFFDGGEGAWEDPVTGSLNAGLAQWLIGSGRLPSSYVAGQGSALHRDGRVHVTAEGPDRIWVGGDVVTVISGQVQIATA